MSDFQRAFDIVLRFEGGVTDDPNDPGGLTKWGVSHAAHPELDINSLTKLDAERIYRNDYWQACQCYEMPWPLSLYVFDTAVNMGVNRAAKLLQKALNLNVDGMIGPKTVKASQNATQDQMALFLAERAIYYASLRNFVHYGRGWLKRTYMLPILA